MRCLTVISLCMYGTMNYVSHVRGKTWLQAVSVEQDTHNGDLPPLSSSPCYAYSNFCSLRDNSNGAQQWISLSSSSPLFFARRLSCRNIICILPPTLIPEKVRPVNPWQWHSTIRQKEDPVSSFFSKTVFINLGNESRCTFSSVTRQRSQKPVCLSYTGNPTPVAPSFFSSETTLAFPFSFPKINCAPFLPNERRETWLIMTAT